MKLLTPCIEWQGRKDSQGYGQVSLGKPGGWRSTTTAHRQVLERKLGRKLKRNEYARHHCDNPPCVNEEHIFLGAPRDNTQDSIRKGRFKPPDNKGRRYDTRLRKLTDGQVRAIRKDRRAAHVVALEFGVSESAVYGVRARRRKALVPDF